MTSTPERLARLSPQKLALLKQVMGESAGIAEPVAVVGMGCRFAGASSIEDYWRLIHDATDTTGEIPSSRWDVDAFYDASGQTPGKMPTRWGGFLENIDRFDAAFFGISPREAEKMDPQHRLLLQVVWESLEYGGLAPSKLRESSTGVFVGVGGVDYSRIPVQLDNYFEQITAYSGTGNALSIAANRISYTLDLRGPSIAIDTACSSSLVAAHLAVRSLRSKECDMAIVGGVNAILTPETTLAFSQAQMLSPDGKCRPFDDQANGYVRGEGCGVIVLKRLSDAVSAGDLILATIRGSAVNQDGMTSGITAPRGTAQVKVIRQALRDAGRNPDDISYIEAHGTATPLGDPIELQALAEVFGKQNSSAGPCYIGSVKGNIGHTETSAGMASLIKSILMLRKGMIPKQAHFQKLNRHVDLSHSRLQVANEVRPWDAGKQTPAAGVSSFGFGGTNAHVVLEAAEQSFQANQADRPKHVLTLSAKTPERLRELASRISQSITQPDEYPLADACHTAAVGRSHFNHRLAVPTGDAAQLRESLDAFAAGDSSNRLRSGKSRSDRRLNIAFMFTGQGAQYVGMGRQLFDSHPVFREALESCDQILADLLPERLLKVLLSDDNEEPLLNQTLYTQPALFSIEYALSRLWRSFGIEPSVMIGHSVGDYVAACEAGVFSLADGLTLISHRARLVQSLPRDGMMAVVLTERDQVADLLMPYSDQVAIAAHNGPQQVVISGHADVVRDLLDQFELAGIKTRALEVSHAMHSPLLEPILDEFEEHASKVTYHPAKIPLVSSRDGELIGQRIGEPGYWRDHLRNTVNFANGVQALQPFLLDAAVEIGPGTTLCSLAGRMWDGPPVAWLPSLRRGRDDWDVLTETLADLYVRGADIDWASFDKPWSRKRQVLPTYPFEEQSFWYDMSRRMAYHASPVIAADKAHPLLGNRLPMAGDKTVFEATLDAHRPKFLVDHCVDQSPVVPAAAYIEQAMAAAKSLFGDGSHSLSNLSIQQPLVLANDQRRVVQVQVGPEHRGECNFEIYSRPTASEDENNPTWTLHASGTLHNDGQADASTAPAERSKIESRMADSIDGESFYQRMAECGLQYGPMFQVLSRLSAGENESLALLEVDDNLQQDLEAYQLHPAILDGCLQSIAGVVTKSFSDSTPELFLPTHSERVRTFKTIRQGPLWIHTRLTKSDPDTGSFQSDIDLFDEDGSRVATIVGARVQRVARQGGASRSADRTNLLYEIGWHRQTHAGSVADMDQRSDRWLIFGNEATTELTGALSQRLGASGDPVTVVQSGADFALVASEADGGLQTYQIDPCGLSDYEELLQAIASDSARDLTVIDLRGVVANNDSSEAELAEGLCGPALMLLRALGRSSSVKIRRTAILTCGANAVDAEDQVSPAQSALWGLSRTAMVEMPQLSCQLIDLDPNELDPSAGAASDLVLDALLGELTKGDAEDHVAWRQGERFVARLEAATNRFQETTSTKHQAIPNADQFSLRVGQSAGLDSLHYVPIEPKQLAPNEVEIEIKSTGLNFSDVLKALGLYPGVKDEIVPLGIECAGVVSRVGESVDQFHVGQRVMGVAPYSFASHTTTADYAIVATPENISDDEAATIPITFLTAYHALGGLARLAEGDKVLIHAGAGGVGQAAIQIAQAIGAEVFATAGSDEKREFLRSLGVQHVMDSRSLDFADEIMDITSGVGVDVVLNSLPGEAITKSLSILSAYGRFLEIGKTDIYQNRRIGLWPFQDNLSYFAIDLDRMLRQRPNEIRRLYEQVMPAFAQGTYRPLPLKSFAPDSVVDAFRYMAQRKNVGKVVVSMSDRPDDTATSTSPASPIKADGTILITGGLGALGRKVIDWVLAQGAEHVVVLSRRGADDWVRQRMEELRASGVSLAVIKGDVGNAKSLAEALEAIPASFPPVRGVFHAAGVLRDGVMHTMDLDQLHQAMAPKTQGAWNLHRALESQLDVFVLFSSVAGTIGSPGQANYAAGNAFMDGLAALRRRLGQPATSIAWGPWDEDGMAADSEVRRQLSERGMSPLAPETAIGILDKAIQSDVTNLAVMDVQWNVLLDKLAGGGSSLLASFRPDEVSGQDQQRRSRDEQLCKQLESASSEARIEQLELIIAAALSDVMGVDVESIEKDQPLASLGLDSLMGMELRSNLEAKLGIEIPVASLFDDPTVISLARVAAELFAAGNPIAADGVDGIASRVNSTPDLKRKSALVALGGAHGNDTPVFCVHPVGGDLRCYDGFARALKGRPVYGLRAQGLQAGSNVHETIDAMIGDYVDTIRESQPDGPYCLMGWSTGGIFAYEIARRLHQQQLPLQSLIMVDTPLPAVFEKVDLGDDARFLVDLVEFANYFAGTSMAISYDELRQQNEEQAIHHVLHLAIKHGVLPAKTTYEYLHRLINVCKRHVEILQAYKPTACPIPVHLLRPEDTGMLSEATGQSLHTDDLGWGSLVQLQTHEVPGHHFTMMIGPNAITLAEKVDELIREAAGIDVNETGPAPVSRAGVNL